MTGHASDDPGGGASPSLPAQERADAAARADLDAAFLQEVCDLVAGELPGVVVSFMGEGGRIIASSARERLGDIHEGAARVMRGEVDKFEVTAEMAARSATMREGRQPADRFRGPARRVPGARRSPVGGAGLRQHRPPLGALQTCAPGGRRRRAESN